MTYLAVPIAAKDLNEAARQIDAAIAAGAEAIELRTDYIENLSVELVGELIAQARSAAADVPLIVTCREKKQGGIIDYPLALRLDVLIAAVQAGVEFIDIEYDNFILTEVKQKVLGACLGRTTRLILSAHNFQAPFADIKKLCRDVLAACPDAIPKLVYTASHINDCFEAFDLLHDAKQDTIAFCMGEAGLISRLITKKLGGFVTFASLDEKTGTAPGQSTIEQLKDLYHWDSIDAETELYGVIGAPIAHSLSPAIHNACFADAGLNKLYLPLLVAGGQGEFSQFVDNCLSREWLDFRGFSVTIPHKENALNYVKSKTGFVEPLAERIGAANTLIIEHRASSIENRVSAYNTDYSAALDSITAALRITRTDLKDMSVAIIGAGGVARAIVAGLADAGAKVKIYNRTVEKAKRLAVEFKCDYASLDALHKPKEKLIINCTSIGMHPNTDSSPFNAKLLQKHMAVFDTVYNPLETKLLKEAKEVGAKTISGLDMFVNQAIAQFKLFTGKNADSKFMKRIVCESV